MSSYTDNAQSWHKSILSDHREGEIEENLSQASMQLCDRQQVHSRNGGTCKFEEWEEDFFLKKLERSA